MNENHTPVLIVGGGPVGLGLGPNEDVLKDSLVA